MERVFITGAGVRSAIGDDLDAFWQSLQRGTSGVRLFDGDAGRGLQPYAAAPAALDAQALQSKQLRNRSDRVVQLSLLAVAQALRQAGLPPLADAPDRAGVFWGSGAGGAGTNEAAYREYYGAAALPRIPPLTVVMTMANAAAGQISIQHGLRGPLLAVSNACASAAQAIGEGLFALRAGRAGLLIVGGADASLYPGWIKAWQALGVLAPGDDPPRACKPFDVGRTGLVLAEGAGALVIETESHAARRDAHPLAELAGYGVSADAAHLSKPDVQGQVRAMRAAIDDAKLKPRSIAYVNAHATATDGGDPVEVDSLREVFGDAVPWTSSTKALHGHAMGASGAIELIAGLLALGHRQIPMQWYCERPLDGARLALPGQGAAWPATANAVLSNSFAFGGCSVSLVLKSA